MAGKKVMERTRTHVKQRAPHEQNWTWKKERWKEKRRREREGGEGGEGERKEEEKGE